MDETDVNEWNVPSSDDEQVCAKEGEDLEEEKREIPLKVLVLYSEIEKKGFIELKVEECRRGVKENIVQSCVVFKEEESQRVDDSAEERNTSSSKEIPGKEVNSPAKLSIEKDKTPEPSAFDYTEESTDETSHITRKIPKTERFQRKRVGTLENVISDLKRFRDMDNKETGDADNKIAPAKPDSAMTSDESTR